MISIKGLDKPEVLAALYNASHPQGLRSLHYRSEDMTREQAAAILTCHTSFDYLYGRVMKVNLESHEEFDPSLYDRDNGDGAAARALERLKAA